MQAQPAAQSLSAQDQPGFPIDQEALNNLIAISGSSREACTQALRAAFGDPNRAYEYLASGMGGIDMGQLGGIPPGMLGDEMMDGEYGEEGEEEGDMDMGGNPFEAFASNPKFVQLR